MAWTNEGNTHGEKREKGLLLVSQGVAFLSFPGEGLLESAQNPLSEEVPGLVDTLQVPSGQPREFPRTALSPEHSSWSSAADCEQKCRGDPSAASSSPGLQGEFWCPLFPVLPCLGLCVTRPPTLLLL